jgi:hypothetical protein
MQNRSSLSQIFPIQITNGLAQEDSNQAITYSFAFVRNKYLPFLMLGGIVEKYLKRISREILDDYKGNEKRYQKLSNKVHSENV